MKMIKTIYTVVFVATLSFLTTFSVFAENTVSKKTTSLTLGEILAYTLIPLAIAIIVTVICAVITAKKPTVKTNSDRYIDNKDSKILGGTDNYIRTTRQVVRHDKK